MRRESIFGGDIIDLISYDWPLPEVGLHRITFGQCQSSGFIFQSESISPELMSEYYSRVATYVNPNSDGKPTGAKVADVQRLIDVVKQNSPSVNEMPRMALQIGSSDGYTLHAFQKAGVDRVLGVDPGEASVQFAEDRYGVKSLLGGIEDVHIPGDFDLVILTHVLEHLYRPDEALRKLYLSMSDESKLLVEVPLWERLDRQPVGVLAFEHVNYFCEHTLVSLLSQEGFEIEFLSKGYCNNHYPVITALAYKSKGFGRFDTEPQVERNRNLARQVIERDNDIWLAVNERLSECVKGHDVYIYGGGVHTSQLLSNTSLLDCYHVLGIFDSSPSKWGKTLGGIIISPFNDLKLLAPGTNVVISSKGWEAEIVKSIYEVRNDLNVITLYQD